MAKTYLSQPEDYPLLQFLWKWKVATTSCLCRKMYPKVSAAGGYYRLWRMQKAGFIQTRVDTNGRHFVWFLTEKGYKAIREKLPVLKEDGFRSENPRHDLLVSAIHLGEWLFSEPTDTELFSEQDLRRIDPEFYPTWVPKNTQHVPDGYWQVNGGKGQETIALEVELTQKRARDYERIARFYENHPAIGKVLWVVSKTGLANAILRAIHKATDEASNHNFVLLGDVLRLGWHAAVQDGPDRGSVISGMLAKTEQSTSKSIFPHFAFDTRKSPHISKLCAESALFDFADWIGLKPSKTQLSNRPIKPANQE